MKSRMPELADDAYAPRLEFLLALGADVGEVVSMGPGPLGERRVVSITGGSFEGPELRGEILPGQVVRVSTDGDNMTFNTEAARAVA